MTEKKVVPLLVPRASGDDGDVTRGRFHKPLSLSTSTQFRENVVHIVGVCSSCGLVVPFIVVVV